MSTELSGKVALVTGGGRGLGLCVARGLASRGARVAIVARSSEQVAAAVAEIQTAGGVALGVAADVTQPPAVAALCRRIESEFGPPTILVNAAGVFGPIQRIEESDIQRWIETLMVNTIGPYLTCRALIGGMRQAGWGRIINFSSAASLHAPGPLNSAYGTSKVALNQFTRHLAAELAGTGVSANVIHPGEVKTDMWAAIRDEAQSLDATAEGYRKWAAYVGASGGDPPEKALELVLSIVRDESAANSGKFLWIDGGIQAPIASW
jgi:NAD(P)-dependent dehydrogenase (short-subunit alcohol dehydrogenase family)